MHLQVFAVARSGHGDMAVSNVLGRNVFDILIGLGLPWFIGGLAKGKAQAVTVYPVVLVVIPIAVLLGTAILFIIVVVLLAVLAPMKEKLSRPVVCVSFFRNAGSFTHSMLDVLSVKIVGDEAGTGTRFNGTIQPRLTVS